MMGASPTPKSRAAEESAAWILARTVALYAQAEGGNPVLEGTGLLLKIADVAFLVSAAHVFAGTVKDQRRMLIGLGPNVRLGNLGGLMVEMSRDRDAVDIAFARLSEATASEISKHKEFLRLDQVDLDHAPPFPGWYCVLGFPREHTAIIAADQLVKLEPYCLHTSLYEGDLRDEAFTIGTSIALSFAPLGLSDANGESVRVPMMGGISGCGIWCVATSSDSIKNDTWSPDMIRLAGIEHGVVGKRIIKGTMAFHLLIAIKQRYPELKPAIMLARSSRGEPRPIVFRSRQV
jgi:hypothetical protein